MGPRPLCDATGHWLHQPQPQPTGPPSRRLAHRFDLDIQPHRVTHQRQASGPTATAGVHNPKSLLRDRLGGLGTEGCRAAAAATPYGCLMASTCTSSRTLSEKPKFIPHVMPYWLRTMVVSKSPPQTSTFSMLCM